MTYQEPVETTRHSIREVGLGVDGHVTVGGAGAMPFHAFDGAIPHKPLIAVDVMDTPPADWPAWLTESIGDEVLSDSAGWARTAVERWGADMICVQLASTDPNGADTSPEDAAAVVRSVTEAVDVPVMVYGSGNTEKDAEVLKKVGEAVSDSVIAIGPATEDNYKQIVATALAYGHVVIAESPIDVNMAKQLNILMTQMGLPAERIMIDPSVGAVGYGVEYAYTVMERLRLAALNQGDDMTRMPLVCNLGREVWRIKETRVSEEDEPTWGEPGRRGAAWEAVTASGLLMAGADVLVMRHPEAVAAVRRLIESLSTQDAAK